MDRISNAETTSSSETKWEVSLRPQNFGDFPGQDKIKEKLDIFVRAAKTRGETLDHVLFCGPPGLGKTTLAHIVANELGGEIKVTSGPALDKKGELAAVLTSLKPNSILFVDEIHRLNKNIEEYLYSAMEDFTIDIITGEGLGARVMKFKLAPFTLIGATTRAGLMDKPFLDRFGIVERLSFYQVKDIVQIVSRSANLLGVDIEEGAALEIAKRCRATPRIANRLLKRVRDYAQVKNEKTISTDTADYALNHLDVDRRGLDPMDRQILTVLCEKFQGGPTGIDTLSAALSEDRGTLEEVYEPFLLQEGFIQKTPRGRVATDVAYSHLGIKQLKSTKQDNLDLEI
ncbi:MAG: Holliday junction branch migration DNA helicase RuvB [Bdellovibrionales bacterium]|nr:Holliday junction branch migration DNA helicase RuvB [Bdellovibrionales bacterium]